MFDRYDEMLQTQHRARMTCVEDSLCTDMSAWQHEINYDLPNN